MAFPSPAPSPSQIGLRVGASGPEVTQLQRRLSELGYWLGEPDGTYGGLTQQAVLAFQKAAGLERDGVAGPATLGALAKGVAPQPHSAADGIEVDKERQLVMVVREGRARIILNSSTGSGEWYVNNGTRNRAVTPTGTYSVFRFVEGVDRGPLGDLYRPRYFNRGIAIHGAESVPGYPASHGCVRVSNSAMDMLVSHNLVPVGGQVRVY